MSKHEVDINNYITCIDVYSGYGYEYLMRRKSETFDWFEEFRADVEKHLSLPMVSIYRISSYDTY